MRRTSGSTRTGGRLADGLVRASNRLSIVSAASSASSSGTPSGPKGLDQARIIGAPIEKPGFSIENGIRKRMRLRRSLLSLMMARRITRSSSLGIAGARKRPVKNTFGSSARFDRKSSSPCNS
ncbi:hypothetical protein D3C87_1647020 [compost metagenome]